MRQGLNATELKVYRDRIMYACMNSSSIMRMIEHYTMLSRKAFLNDDREEAWMNLCKVHEQVLDYDKFHEELRSVLMDMDKDLKELDPEAHDRLVAELTKISAKANK